MAMHILRFHAALALALILLATPACASAQSAPPVTPSQPGARSFRPLAAGVPQASGELPLRELRLRLTTEAPAAAGAPGAAPQGPGSRATLRLMGDTRTRGRLRRERRPEVSVNDLVVVLSDDRGVEIDWRIVRDPRIVRAEVPDAPGGALVGRTVERQDAELLVSIPDTGATRLMLYKPRWTGTDYELDALAQLPLGTTQ